MTIKESDVSEGVARLRELLERATPGPWQLQDGCSWRRIGTAFHDGDVLCPDTYSREDRHPDLTARDGRLYDNLRLIVEGINALPGLLDIVEATLSPPLPSPGVERWQPIESAPKDGTWLLAAEDNGPDFVCDAYAACWVSEGDDGYWIAKCGQYVTQTPEPTHWMPLVALSALPLSGDRTAGNFPVVARDNFARQALSPLSDDVVRLVIAAREVAFGPVADSVRHEPEFRDQMKELDAASEAFASRVPWEDAPEDDDAALSALPLDGGGCG